MTDLDPKGLEKAAEVLYLAQKDEHHPAWGDVNGWARDAYMEDTEATVRAYMGHVANDHPTPSERRHPTPTYE